MYKLVPAERQKHSNETITKNAANHQKMACSGAFGTPGWARTSGLSLRSSKNLVFNRVPVCPVMSEKPWNIKDFR